MPDPWSATKRGFEDWATERMRSGQPYDTSNTKIVNGRVQKQGSAFIDDWKDLAILGGSFAPLALAGIGGLGGGAAASGGPGVVSGIPGGALPGASVAAPSVAAKGGIMGGFGKFLGKLDPTTLLLGGLSLLGGDEGPDPKNSFKGTAADPVQSLSTLLRAIEALSGSIANKARPQFPGGVVNRPTPVSVPGIPFQIGGGLGTDPAMRATGQLTGPNPIPSPFGVQGANGQPARPVRRRTPGGSE